MVRRIEIKIATADEQVFRIWRFENQYSPGFERAASLVEKPHEGVQRQVLGKVKSRDRIEAVISQCAEIRERLSLHDIQRQLFAALQHNTIRIDPARLKS